MKTEIQSCCLCFHIASGGNAVDSDILQLLKFLIVNLNTSALENCPVCDSCLNKILETSEYKRKNSTKTVDTKNEIDCEKSICQKCEKVCEQGETFPLMDSITQLDWSDFVNYLFPDQDSQSLENLQICGSCRESVSNIQDFLVLIYVYDQSKMKLDFDSSDNIIVTENENLVRDKVEIKQEFKNIVSDKTEIQDTIQDNKVEMICSDSKGDSHTTYADFVCKNEEVELKCESDDSDDDPSSDRYENETSRSDSHKNSLSNEEEEEGINTQGCSNRLRYGLKIQNNIRDFKCIYCSDRFTTKLNLHDHLLTIHKCRDGVTSKIYDCNECNYMTAKKSNMLRHGVKHGIKGGLEKYKCQYCTYETYVKWSLIRHAKTHNNNRDITVALEKYNCYHCTYETNNKSYLMTHIKTHFDSFKCTLCSKKFARKTNLNNHFLVVHKSKDTSVSKILVCDVCSYKTTFKSDFLKHKIKHGIKIGFEKYKCRHCIYETDHKGHFFRHIKTHNGLSGFKCTLCSKSFTVKRNLDDHLLIVHKSRDNVTSKIHECDKCSYSTINKSNLLVHKLKHGVKIGFE